MEFAELKSTFLKTMVERGYTDVREIPEEAKVGIPPKLVDRWVRQFNTSNVLTAIPQNPRLINRFTIGADPEFSLTTPQGGLVPALKLGLHTGLAFGMDNNGRLVELRPSPSKFALDVLASILVELRWLALYYPGTIAYNWVSSPFDGQDGVGGHVHFARKRDEKTRWDDIEGLDTLYTCLLKTNVFNKPLNDLRVNKTKYGHTKDYRLQRHGFEYRSFPTWLDSPWLAYFVLVLSKLAVYDCNLMDNILANGNNNVRTLERSIMNLLALYKGMDDDAWIAYQALQRWGLPKQQGGDFRANWGIMYPKLPPIKSPFYPSMIDGSEKEREAVFQYLINRTPIRPELPVCSWEPKEIPDGFQWMLSSSPTYHRPGIGEIVNDLVYSNKLQVVVQTIDNEQVRLDTGSHKCAEGIEALVRIKPGLVSYYQKAPDNIMIVYLPVKLRVYDTIQKVRDILTSGIFPIWKIGEVRFDSFETWVNQQKGQSKKLIGKELVL